MADRELLEAAFLAEPGARQATRADFVERWPAHHRERMTERLHTAAQLAAEVAKARAEERERCAKLCHEYAHKHAKDDDDSKAQAWMMLQCAAAIRQASSSAAPVEGG